MRFTITIGLLLFTSGISYSQAIDADSVYVVRTGPVEIHRNPLMPNQDDAFSEKIVFESPAYDFEAYVFSLLRNNGYTFYDLDHPIQRTLAQISKRGIVEITDRHSTEHPVIARHLVPVISINVRSVVRVFTDLSSRNKTREEIIAEYLENASEKNQD